MVAFDDCTEALHYLGCLILMRPRADMQIHIWITKAELFQKHLRHAQAVVLSGVHQQGSKVAMFPHLAHDGRHLHHVWTSAHYTDDVEYCFAHALSITNS